MQCNKRRSSWLCCAPVRMVLVGEYHVSCPCLSPSPPVLAGTTSCSCFLGHVYLLNNQSNYAYNQFIILSSSLTHLPLFFLVRLEKEKYQIFFLQEPPLFHIMFSRTLYLSSNQINYTSNYLYFIILYFEKRTKILDWFWEALTLQGLQCNHATSNNKHSKVYDGVAHGRYDFCVQSQGYKCNAGMEDNGVRAVHRVPHHARITQ